MISKYRLKAKSLKFTVIKDAQSGNVLIITALCMTILLGIFAFVLNTGFLYAGKNKYQNAVEAAAMAGAVSLCDEDPEAAAKTILLQNLLSDDDEGEDFPEEYTVDIVTGYYDESGEEDFSESSEFGYRSFIEADRMPDDTYVNSLLVRLTVDHQAILSGLLGKNNVSIQVAAAAYLKRYAFLALGDDGIQTLKQWNDGYPAFQDASIHSNSQILFSGTESFIGKSPVTAVDMISGGSGTSGVDKVEIAAVDWEDLKEAAQNSGRVYQPGQWSEGFQNDQGDWQTDDFGNEYLKSKSGDTYFFCPADGDHDGATYFFAMEDEATSGTLLILNEQDWRSERDCRHLTIAAEMDIKVGWFGGTSYTSLLMSLGGPDTDMVRLYSKGDILFRDRYGGFKPVNYQCNGLVMISEKNVTIQTSLSTDNPDYGSHYLRVIADSIVFEKRGTGSANLGKILFDGLFAPPCPPRIVQLCRLNS